jgi:hypothetical protein
LCNASKGSVQAYASVGSKGKIQTAQTFWMAVIC